MPMATRKYALVRIFVAARELPETALYVGYELFRFLNASRQYNNDETAGNEMLRLLHSL